MLYDVGDACDSEACSQAEMAVVPGVDGKGYSILAAIRDLRKEGKELAPRVIGE